MSSSKKAAKGASAAKEAINRLPAADLVQLNLAHAEAAQAKMQMEHAATRHQLLEALREAARLRRELSTLKQELSERDASEQSAAQVQEAQVERNAAASRWDDLAAELRARYALDPKQGIDPLTGAILAARTD